MKRSAVPVTKPPRRRRTGAGAICQREVVSPNQQELFPAVIDQRAAPGELNYLAAGPAATAFEALIDDECRWQHTPEGHYIYGDHATTYVVMGDPRVAISTERIASAWTKILALDDNTAQTFLYVMGRDLTSTTPGEKTRIHVNEILDFKGIKRHKNGDFRQGQKRLEVDRLRILNEMWFHINDEVRLRAGRGIRTKKIKLISRVIELEFEEERRDQSPDFLASDAKISAPYAFRIGLGGWALPYRAFPAAIRPVLQTIVQYDTTSDTQRTAMRIALFLMFSMPERRGQWGLRELLEKARIQIPRTNTMRFRDMIESALDRLQNDRLIGTWVYANDKPMGYRWFQNWLGWDVVISPRPLKVVAI
jgi:hypothetical protein